MERRPNYLAGPLIALVMLLVPAAYVAGYFAVSEVFISPLGEMRVFPSEFVYDLYGPLQSIEERFNGRQMRFSE